MDWVNPSVENESRLVWSIRLFAFYCSFHSSSRYLVYSHIFFFLLSFFLCFSSFVLSYNLFFLHICHISTFFLFTSSFFFFCHFYRFIIYFSGSLFLLLLPTTFDICHSFFFFNKFVKYACQHFPPLSDCIKAVNTNQRSFYKHLSCTPLKQKHFQSKHC